MFVLVKIWLKDGLVCFVNVINELVVKTNDTDSESILISKGQGEGRPDIDGLSYQRGLKKKKTRC